MSAAAQRRLRELDPGVSRETLGRLETMVETLLRAKRVDGAEAALLTIAAANFTGDRQKLLDPVIWSAIAAKLLVIWGERDATADNGHTESKHRRRRHEKYDSDHAPLSFGLSRDFRCLKCSAENLIKF